MPTIAERIKEFNKDRLAEFTQLKYRIMAGNAFSFFRGTCHLFYEDIFRDNPLPFSPPSWICGDLHLENFGSYKGDNRLVYFDLNDFDEAILSPVNWELARMICSIVTGFDALSIKKAEALNIAQLFLKAYSHTLSNGKAHYIEPQIAKGIVKTFLEKVVERKQKELIGRRTDSQKDGLRLLVDNKRCYVLDKSVRKKLISELNDWIPQKKDHQYHFRAIDAGFRIAGTGSLGQRRYVFLVQSTLDSGKHALLDMKESLPSSLQPFTSLAQPSWGSQAERIIAIQTRMQNVSPAFLSPIQFEQGSYVLKELQPTDDKINFALIKDRFKDVERVIRDMAILTASAQLRSAGRQGSASADELLSFGQDENWQKLILDYGVRYADQVKSDYQSFLKEYKAGYFDGK
jgi:uncharacterized protein (DUF2252 family)